MKNRVLVIGAGVHGMTAAIELASNGYNVTVIDKSPKIFGGASGATHNRAHMGYHYPRSIETGQECIKGLDHFISKYPSVVVDEIDSYYLIEKSGHTTFKDYKKFCKELKIPYKQGLPSKDHMYFDNIENGLKTREPIFNIERLKHILLPELLMQGGRLRLMAELVQFGYRKDGSYTATVQIGDDPSNITYIDADIVVNATYAYSNNVLKILGLERDMVEYRLQHTEVIAVRTDLKLPSITIMDGPFVSIMKRGGYDDQYLLYDVKNSILHEEKGHFLEEREVKTNYLKMIHHFGKYFKFMKDLEYVESWYGTRPIPTKVLGDERTTNIKEHNLPNVYSIMEGKFISATLIAEELTNKIKNA